MSGGRNCAGVCCEDGSNFPQYNYHIIDYLYFPNTYVPPIPTDPLQSDSLVS